MFDVTINGRLGKDAELRQAGNSQVCSFSVAAESGFGNNKQTHWVECSLWGARGVAIQQYLKKGGEVVVVGEFSEREYNGKQYKQVNAYNVQMVGGQGSSQSQGQQQNNQQQGNSQQNNQQQGFNNQMSQAPQGYAQNGAPSVPEDDVPF